MSRESPTSLAAYARAIERRWADFLDRPTLLSQRDWELIRDWHGRGVPLAVVWGAIEAAEASRRRRRAAPRGLAALAPAVEEEWQALSGGRVAAAGTDFPPVERPAPADAWRARQAAEPPGSPLGGLLDGLLARLEGGAPPADIDRCLDVSLEEAAPPALLREERLAVEREIAPHRGRMPSAALEATLRNALVLRLRERLGLPRLAVPSDPP